MGIRHFPQATATEQDHIVLRCTGGWDLGRTLGKVSSQKEWWGTGLHREMDPPSLEVLKKRLDMAFSIMVYLTVGNGS